jgi:hypothetical protein
MTFDLLNRVVRRTPVDTGRARAGWSAAGRALGMSIPVPENASPEDSEYEEHLDGDDKYIRITNRVHYVPYLEYGHSTQAPLGMVRISMVEMQVGKKLPAAMMRSYKKLWKTLGSGGRYSAQDEAFTSAFSGEGGDNLGRAAPIIKKIREARK